MPPTYCNSKQIGGIFIAKLIVAEKPSVAMSYAKVLGATSRKDGYLEGNGYLVSWCVGHLVELAPPNIYDAKYVKWSIGEIENEQLLTALETLKVEDLEIITMYAYEGYDITEISKVYGVSRPTISIKIKRITKFLKNFNFNATN